MTSQPSRPSAEPNYASGIIAMSAAMAFFVFSDVFTKLATERLPVGQVITLRGAISFFIFIVPSILFGYLVYLRDRMSWPWLIRVMGEMGAALTFIPALAHMPLADLTAIVQTIPLAMTAAGALILGELVGIRRWTATMIGFLGALLIIQPGTDQFTWWSLAALGCVASVVVRDIATRKLDTTIPAMMTTATTAFGVMIAGLVLGATEASWPAPDTHTWALLFSAALAVACGYYCSIVAIQKAPLSIVAPFRYTIMPMALIAGIIVWGDRPSLLAACGMTVIVGAGLYTYLRERKRKPLN